MISAEPRRNLQALLWIWHELPSLLGPDWSDLFPRCRDLLVQIESCADPGDCDWLVLDLIDLLREHDAARRRLKEVRDLLGTDRGNRGQGDPGPETPLPEWEELGPGIERRLNPPTVTRYTDVSAPRRLQRGSLGAMTVGLSLAPNPESVDARGLELSPDPPVEVHCHAAAEDFEVLGASVRSLAVESDVASEPIAFRIRALREGLRPVRLDFRQSGALVGTVRVEIEVVSQEVASEEQRSVQSSLEVGGAYAPPADLDIRVVYEAEPPLLRYVFHSPAGSVDVHYLGFDPVKLVVPAQSYFQLLLERLETLKRGLDADGGILFSVEVTDKFEALGHTLFRELIPKPVRELYRRVRGAVRTLQITSDEPWIPWELVKPYDDDVTPAVDDDFLCTQFQMTRWLAGETTPRGEVRVSKVGLMDVFDDPAAGDIPSERRCFTGLVAARPGLVVDSPQPVTRDTVTSLLDAGGYQLLHFATHGEADPRRIGEAALLFANQTTLRAEDLHGRRQTLLRADRPLVFLNACHAGRQEWELTRLGGWVSAWVERCRCSSFIGPLWVVGTGMAGLMAETFYEELAQGSPIGEAARKARQAVRAASPSNPTWLAYSVYAHPNARVVWPPKGEEGVSV
jgi:hypothetical protein